jgi:hypothetical protein
MTIDLLGRYGLDPRLVEWFEAADHGTCHCGQPGVYVEQRANTWHWYCPAHRPNFRACHICGQPGVAFEHVAERWLWYCTAHAEGRRGQCSQADLAGQSASDRSDPAALCVCGLRGQYSRPRKDGKDGRVWRCEGHKNSWPDYAEDVAASGRLRGAR